MGSPSPFMKMDRTKEKHKLDKRRKIMRKNVKTLGALVCAVTLGMGATGNTVMAATPGQGNTNVYYTSDSTSIDKDGKILLVIPADVNLNKDKTTGTTELKLKTSNGKNFDQFGVDFNAKVGVSSKHQGNLQDTTGGIKAPYKLKNNTDKSEANWNDVKHNENFADFNATNSGTVSESKKTLEVSVDEKSVTILEGAPKGTQFTDILTFKVTALQGNGLTEVK